MRRARANGRRATGRSLQPSALQGGRSEHKSRGTGAPRARPWPLAPGLAHLCALRGETRHDLCTSRASGAPMPSRCGRDQHLLVTRCCQHFQRDRGPRGRHPLRCLVHLHVHAQLHNCFSIVRASPGPAILESRWLASPFAGARVRELNRAHTPLRPAAERTPPTASGERGVGGPLAEGGVRRARAAFWLAAVHRAPCVGVAEGGGARSGWTRSRASGKSRGACGGAGMVATTLRGQRRRPRSGARPERRTAHRRRDSATVLKRGAAARRWCSPPASSLRRMTRGLLQLWPMSQYQRECCRRCCGASGPGDGVVGRSRSASQVQVSCAVAVHCAPAGARLLRSKLTRCLHFSI